MSEEIRNLSRRRSTVDAVAVALGFVALVAAVLLGQRYLLIATAYGLLLGTGTAVVTYALTRFTGIAIEGADAGRDGVAEGRASSRGGFREVFTGRALEGESDVEQDTGWLVGRLENVLVLTLVLAGQYTALSIIFAAKSWVRVEDTASGNTTYYLAGTLVNFTYSILVGVVAVRILGTF